MSTLAARGLVLETHPDVYLPSDDTWLLADAVRVRPGMHVLDIGTGTGAIAIHAARQGARVVATDLNPAALRLCRDNARRNDARVEAVQADLLQGLRLDRFDLVCFNPPYLPTSEEERVPGPLNHAFDGGAEGRTTLTRFLSMVRLRSSAKALVVVSSLQGLAEAANEWRRAGFDAEPVGTARLPYETLTIVALSPKRSRAAPA